MHSGNKKPTIFAPSKSHRIFFLAELLQPYYGSHPEHHFAELDTFPTLILGNECLRKLYDLTIENLNMHNYSDALFFCDKLLTLSNNHIASIYLMGECYFRNSDFKKVHSLFQTHKVLSHNISFQLLAAKSLFLNKQYDQCLSVLDQHLDNTYSNNKMESSKSFLRGQCNEAQ
jgi:tetratricopeptide (TPR) repeat protein